MLTAIFGEAEEARFSDLKRFPMPFSLPLLPFPLRRFTLNRLLSTLLNAPSSFLLIIIIIIIIENRNVYFSTFYNDHRVTLSG